MSHTLLDPTTDSKDAYLRYINFVIRKISFDPEIKNHDLQTGHSCVEYNNLNSI